MPRMGTVVWQWWDSFPGIKVQWDWNGNNQGGYLVPILWLGLADLLAWVFSVIRYIYLYIPDSARQKTVKV